MAKSQQTSGGGSSRSGPDQGPPLGYLLRQAAAAHRLAMERALSDLGVTPPQFLVLTMVARNPGCSNADLARMASLTTPTVTVIVKNLKRLDALQTRPYENHGRLQHLDLTDIGFGLLAACRERAASVEAELQAGLTSEEIKTISTWLRFAASQEPSPKGGNRFLDSPARG